MNNKLTDEILMDLYKKNYTLKEIAELYDHTLISIIRKVRKLIDSGQLEERPRLTRSRNTIYCSDNKIPTSENNINNRVITDEDIMTLIGYGFSESRISRITSLSVELIKDIVDKYRDCKDIESDSKINRYRIIELYNNRLTQYQIYAITGYTSKVINNTLHQALRAGFIEPRAKYILNKKEKTIINLYKEYLSIDTISKRVNLTTDEIKDTIKKLIDMDILEERDNILKILNTKRISIGIEDYTILKMYNTCISEEIIASYYKVPTNIIIKAISKINKDKIVFYDKIYELAVQEKKSPKYIANKLSLPVDIIYKHLKDIIK